MREFVGAGHREVLEALRARVRDVAAGDTDTFPTGVCTTDGGGFLKEFIEAGHRAVLEVLLARVQGVVAGDITSPRVVILEGPSWVGKSRVVREVYRAIRTECDPQGYWPELQEHNNGGSGSRDPLPGRKCIGPAVGGFVWPPATLPGSGWWQLRCDQMRAGPLIDVVAQARPEIAAHLIPTALAWRDDAILCSVVPLQLNQPSCTPIGARR